MRDNFWNSICSLIWLPLAFFSGIRMKELDANSFAAQAVLPFRRFNRNWYRAMAGGALANSEIAGGTYVFGICGADYTVVCKNLNYTFLRPCFGPAVYRMTPREDIKACLATKKNSTSRSTWRLPSRHAPGETRPRGQVRSDVPRHAEGASSAEEMRRRS